VHAPIGKTSFPSDRLIANAHALMDSVVRQAVGRQGQHLKSVTMSRPWGRA
jgi:ribosomal protein L1